MNRKRIFKVSPQEVAVFRAGLRRWQPLKTRKMPWAGEKDPYRVWLSEVILQQTTVDQGRPYYLKLCRAFPTVQHLARAREATVLRLWQGLGYYARARNLLKAAREVVRTHRGVFPSDYRTLLTLPGIGEYTAAAISSFTANEPRAVVDGNVTRVLARHFGIQTPADTSAGKAAITELAGALLDPKSPGRHNQVLMNFGATQCKPHRPDCGPCPLRRSCAARKRKLVDRLPVRSVPRRKRDRHFNYLVAMVNGKYQIRQRTGNDIWKGLFEFPMIETKSRVAAARVLGRKICKCMKRNNVPGHVMQLKQVLSHQVIHAQFIEVLSSRLLEGCQAVNLSKLRGFAFPRLLTLYFEKRELF